ncbi:MAG: rRNA maturation RNase YbeY [Alphaproteobacteria bacterium]|nr:rRNA maturation RNase YbeY [Alphaproteobacteria bacterium]
MSAIAIAVDDRRWSAVPDLRRVCRRAARAALRSESADRPITLLLADDATLRDLNRRFRAVDTPTNVLAFPSGEDDALDGGAAPLGDVALAFDSVAREARDQGKTLDAHLCHLIVHGVLHLQGHDHQRDDEADAMEAVEIAVLARLGIANPYAPVVRADVR